MARSKHKLPRGPVPQWPLWRDGVSILSRIYKWVRANEYGQWEGCGGDRVVRDTLSKLNVCEREVLRAREG